MTGIVFDIQRASLHDGPGLRTTVFLKGCPLRCKWCHNPESQNLNPEVGASGKVYGREMSVEEVMEAVLADRRFYHASGGGLTISGGEPTVQRSFCLALLQAARTQGIHTCLDTCGHFPPSYLPSLLPLVDLWHYDVKATGKAAQTNHDKNAVGERPRGVAGIIDLEIPNQQTCAFLDATSPSHPDVTPPSVECPTVRGKFYFDLSGD